MSSVIIALSILFLLSATFLYLALTNRNARNARAAALATTYNLTAMMAKFHNTAYLTSATVESVAQCGDGKASTTDRVRVRLTYADNKTTLPTHAILKVILLHPWLRLGGRLAINALATAAALLRPIRLDRLVYLIANTYNYYLPHAPEPMYDNEARFYSILRPELGANFEAPIVLGAQLGRTSCVLIEDLSARGATFPTAREELSLRQLTALLDQLVHNLHGPFWQSPRFRTDLAWLPTATTGGMADVFEAIGFGLIRDHVNTHAFERELLKPLGCSVEQLWSGLKRALHIMEVPPLTLCHGDCHVQNTYLLPEGSSSRVAGFFDFQLSLRACWARDVSYLIATSLPIEARRRHEKELLREYLNKLRKYAGSSAPSDEEAMALYSKCMAWALVIGWLICPPINYGEAIWSANVGRLVAACGDLGTFNGLESGGAQNGAR